jgi:hypothetical protein
LDFVVNADAFERVEMRRASEAVAENNLQIIV